MKYWPIFNKIYGVAFAFIAAPVCYDWFKAESISKRSFILLSISLSIGVLSFILQLAISLFIANKSLKAITKNRDGLVKDWKRLKDENKTQQETYKRDRLEFQRLLDRESTRSDKILAALIVELKKGGHADDTKRIQDHQDN